MPRCRSRTRDMTPHAPVRDLPATNCRRRRYKCNPGGRTEENMRVTVSHNKPKEEVIRAVDRSFDDLFRGAANLPLQLVNRQNNWNRDTLTFSCIAKMGFLST